MVGGPAGEGLISTAKGGVGKEPTTKYSWKVTCLTRIFYYLLPVEKEHLAYDIKSIVTHTIM